MDLVIWIFVWISVWTIINLRRRVKHGKPLSHLLNASFFAFCSIPVYLLFKKYLITNISNLFVGAIISAILGFILAQISKFYKRIRKGRYFLAFHPANIFMQQMFVVAGVYILSNLFSNQYQDYYFGILFTLAHLPIIFLKWAKLRHLYLVFTLFGGTLFSFLIRNYQFGSIATFLIHFIAYIPIICYLKSEDHV